MERVREKLKLLSDYIGKLWLGFAFFLVAGLSFQAGLIQKSLTETEPLIIAAPPVSAPVLPERLKAESILPTQSFDNPSQATSETGTNCAFIGSKNSNKYHAPSSRCAKQIKTANRVCFVSVEAAKARGYLAGCLE